MKVTVPCGKFAVSAWLQITRMMTAPPLIISALKIGVSFLLGTPAPATTALSPSKIILMPCAAPSRMLILETWSYSSSSCVGATTLGGASCYVPLHIFFLLLPPFPYVTTLTSSFGLLPLADIVSTYL